MPSIPFLRRLLAPAALLLAIVAPAHAVDEKDLLPVDAAFALGASAPERGRIELHWRIAEGYYLYRHRISAQPADSAFKFNPIELPAGKKKTDEFFGEVETYRHDLTAVLTGAAATGVDTIELRVKYQGCADLGVCYPPQTRTLMVRLPQDAPPPLSASPGGSNNLDPLGRSLAGGSAASPLLGSIADGKVTLIAGVTDDLTTKVKAGELVNHVAQQVGGKGGGRPDMAQAGGTNPAGLPDALKSVREFVEQRL